MKTNLDSMACLEEKGGKENRHVDFIGKQN